MLIEYNFNDYILTTININNEVWFKGIDITRIIKYKNINNALTRFIDDKYKSTHKNLVNADKICKNIQCNIYINIYGLKILLSKTKKNVSNEFIEFLQENFNIEKYKLENINTIECLEETNNLLVELDNNLEKLDINIDDKLDNCYEIKFLNYTITSIPTDDNIWFKGTDITKALRYKNINHPLNIIPNGKNKSTYRDIIITTNIQNKNILNTIFIDIEGLKILFSNSRKIISNEFKDFLQEKFNIDIKSYVRYEPKEVETLKYLEQSFSCFEIIFQYKCGTYSIDMFIPLYKIAIECDELGHKYRNKLYENKREEYIKQQGFNLIRYNPDEPDFSIFNVINKIVNIIQNNKIN